MVILLPGEGIDQLEADLTRRGPGPMARRFTRTVIVTIPKFKMTCKFAMDSVLRAMGMTQERSRGTPTSPA